MPKNYSKVEINELFKNNVLLQKRILPTIKSDIELIKNIVECQFPVEISFCHNDLLCGNIIYDESLDDVNFIDYEYGSYNYSLFDIANHFCEWAGFETKWEYFPNECQMFDWCKEYLNELHSSSSFSNDKQYGALIIFIIINYFNL